VPHCCSFNPNWLLGVRGLAKVGLVHRDVSFGNLLWEVHGKCVHGFFYDLDMIGNVPTAPRQTVYTHVDCNDRWVHRIHCGRAHCVQFKKMVGQASRTQFIRACGWCFDESHDPQDLTGWKQPEESNVNPGDVICSFVMLEYAVYIRNSLCECL
jgi:hypothetical protein